MRTRALTPMTNCVFWTCQACLHASACNLSAGGRSDHMVIFCPLSGLCRAQQHITHHF